MEKINNDDNTKDKVPHFRQADTANKKITIANITIMKPYILFFSIGLYLFRLEIISSYISGILLILNE